MDPPSTHSRSAASLILGAAVLWGTTGTAQALGPPGSDPLSVGVVRLMIGAAGLWAVAGAAGRLRPHSRLSFAALASTAVGVAAYQPLFFAGVARAGVALGTVVAIGSGPVFAGFLSGIIDRWRPSGRWAAATLLAITGVGLIAGRPADGDALGILFAAGAGFSYAVYAIGSKHLLRSLPPLGAMAYGFGAGALLLSPFLLGVDLAWLSTGRGVAMAAWLGLATTTAAYVLFGYGLRISEVANVATLSLAEPLTATLLGVLVLREAPGPIGWAGAALVLTALVVLRRG